MTSEAVPNQNQAESSAIAAARPPATLRLPVFSSSEPELWLLQVQFAFEAAGIDTDLTRFRILAANLPTEVARDVKDQLTASAPSYANLTKALKDRIAESRAERLQKLLQHQQLGDQKPSQLLRRMRAELGPDGDKDDGILRQLFMNRLSPVTRAALAILPDNEPLEKVATAADRFLQAKSDGEGTSLAALTPPPAHEPAPGEVASLTASVATFTATVARLEASLQAHHREAYPLIISMSRFPAAAGAAPRAGRSPSVSTTADSAQPHVSVRLHVCSASSRKTLRPEVVGAAAPRP